MPRGRKKIDPKHKVKARPVSLNDSDYNKFVQHALKNNESFSSMVRKLFHEDMERLYTRTETLRKKRYDWVARNNLDSNDQLFQSE